nr:hypothetical protein [Tanacetum cinerariifolium]
MVIAKGLTLFTNISKSGENDVDLVENAKTSYLERCGKKFQYPHEWNILRNYPKWNAAEQIDEDNLEELFGPDPRERAKWTRMHGDCQRFNAIYKHLTRKSGENDVDLVENAKTSYLERCAKQIDEDNLEELFGPDPRERPAGKQRASKKQKSVDTSSPGGSTRGSQSESISSLVSQDYRRKCDAAERAYEAKRDKELAMMQCRELRELEFLMLDFSTLPPAKRAIIEKKQVEIMRKYPTD